jgi:GTP-binding protein
MLIRAVEFARPVDSWGLLPDDGRPEVAMVGRSNVGKSSLVNALVGRRQLARTSQTPGKTQALNFYLVEPAAEPGAPPAPPFYLVDLPGYGYAKVAQTQRAAWQRLAERYLDVRSDGPLAVVCQLIDARHEPTALDLALTDRLRAALVPFILVLTKADKLSRSQQQAAAAALRKRMAATGLEAPVVLTSAEKKAGLDALWDWIGTFLPGVGGGPPARPAG